MSQRNDTATHPTGLSADEAALEKRLQEQFLDAQPGTVIEIPAGRHALDRVLTLRANGVTIRGAAAYIDSTYRHYTASYGIDLSGQPTAVPLWSAAGGLDYLWRGVASGDVDFTLQHAYLGGFRCNADSPAQKERLSIPPLQDGRGDQPHDARLAWTSHGLVPVTVAVYSNHLFDNRYVTGVQTISATTLGTPFTNITAPRLYGVEVGARF